MSVRLCLVGCLAAFLVSGAAQGQSREVTRQIPVDESFGTLDLKSGSGFAGGFALRYKIIAVDGRVELCGALAYTNAQTRAAYRRFLNDTYLTLNDRRILKGLGYFNNAKRAARLDNATANCRATAAAVPQGNADFAFDWTERTYRVD